MIATAGDVRVDTALEVERERPAHDVTFHALDDAGAPAASIFTLFGTHSLVIQTIRDGDTLRLADDVYSIDTVSLRGKATDRAGSTVEQTILRAYPVTP